MVDGTARVRQDALPGNRRIMKQCKSYQGSVRTAGTAGRRRGGNGDAGRRAQHNRYHEDDMKGMVAFRSRYKTPNRLLATERHCTDRRVIQG
jgi:hypothetical protein